MASLITGTTSLAVDGWRTDDCGFDISPIGLDHDLVSRPMRCRIRHREHIANAIPVIGYFCRGFTECLARQFWGSEEEGTRSMDVEAW